MREAQSSHGFIEGRVDMSRIRAATSAQEAGRVAGCSVEQIVTEVVSAFCAAPSEKSARSRLSLRTQEGGSEVEFVQPHNSHQVDS